MDTTLKYMRAFFMGMPKAAVSLCRKDLNKIATFIGDCNWRRIPVIFGNDFENPRNWRISIFEYPNEPSLWRLRFNIHSLSVDTGGFLFVTSGGRALPYGYFKTKITMCKYDWNTKKLNYIRDYDYSFLSCGIAVMANDSLCPERCFWVCDSVNNRIVKFDYDGNFQTQFRNYLQNPRIIARGRSVNNYEYYLYVVDNNSRRIVRLKHNKNNNSTTIVNERTFDFEISDIEFDGTLWISDNTNSRLLRLKEDLSEVIYTFGSYGTGQNQFKGINHITIPIGIKNNRLVYFDRMIVGESRWASDCGIQIYRLGVEVKDFRACGTTPYNAKIEFKLTDFAYVTLTYRNTSNNNPYTLLNNAYLQPGYHEYAFHNNPGEYEARIVAKSRFESVRNEPPITDFQTRIFLY